MSRTLRTIKERNFKSLVMLKATIVLYLFLFTVHYLTTTTTALFNAQQKTNITLTAGQWKFWDGSNLEITKEGKTSIDACPAELTISVKNIGNVMGKQSKYEVYYAKSGNPLAAGNREKLTDKEGTIKQLQAEETMTIAYNAKKAGVYAFLIHQTEEHPKYSTISSNIFTVQCKKEQEESPTNEQNKEDVNKESKEKEEYIQENQPEETSSQQNSENNNLKQADTKQSTPKEEQSNETPSEQQEKTNTETQKR